MHISWPALLVICGTLIAIILVLFLPLPSSRLKASRPADRDLTNVVFRDDDRYWYAGIFYYNPDDPAVFVPRRSGLGWSVNFGNPRGRLFVIVILLLVLLFGVILPVLTAGMAPAGCHTLGCQP